jgi:hypothetical protein
MRSALISPVFMVAELRTRRSWTPSIVPTGNYPTVYLVLNDRGSLGRAYCEASEDRSDPETTISDLMSGQYENPARVVSFNTAEPWSKDIFEDIARLILRRLLVLPVTRCRHRLRPSSTSISGRIASSPYGLHDPKAEPRGKPANGRSHGGCHTKPTTKMASRNRRRRHNR